MRYESRRLYRSGNGIIWGVCQGFSDWSGISVGIVRTICVVSFILSGFFPVAFLYAAAALILPVEPACETHHHYHGTSESDWDRRFYRR
jgi:phage shock protein PspC (stress-responsive transcriptional regulator)